MRQQGSTIVAKLCALILVGCAPKSPPMLPMAPGAAPQSSTPPLPTGLLEPAPDPPDPTPTPSGSTSPRDSVDSAELVYFVMVDRFFNGDPSNDGAIERSDPHAFHGGDLAGVRAKLDYLSQLGVTTLWLSPVFKMRTDKIDEWGAFHGYWVQDLSRIEPRFGSDEELRELSRELHRRDMKLVLDMVWNHTDYEAPLRSVHPDWYHNKGDILDWDDPVQVVEGDVHGLPDLAQERPEVAAWLKKVSLEWVERADADGFRIDAVRHMPIEFLRDMNAALDANRPGFWTLGEDFNGDAVSLSKTLTEGGFDAVFDFPLHYAMVDSFCKDAPMDRLGAVLSADRLIADPSRLVTFLDNHDVPRIIDACGGDGWRVDAAFTFLMNTRGTPAITWGTELGLEGGEEPENRRDMPWGRLGALQGDRRLGLQRAMAIRAATPAARLGATRILEVDSDHLVVAQVLPDSAQITRVWRGPPTSAPGLPGWAKAQGLIRGETTRQTGGPSGSLDDTGLHVVVERLEWTGSDGPPWSALLDPPAPKSVEVVVKGDIKGEVRLVGSSPELGAWDPQNAPMLRRASDGSFRGRVELPAGEVAAVKLVSIDEQGTATWESRPDRYLFVFRGEVLTAVDYVWGR